MNATLHMTILEQGVRTIMFPSEWFDLPSSQTTQKSTYLFYDSTVQWSPDSCDVMASTLGRAKIFLHGVSEIVIE